MSKKIERLYPLEVIQTKLANNWTYSSALAKVFDVPEKLESKFKAYIARLAEDGKLQVTGAKRGLRYMYPAATSEEAEETDSNTERESTEVDIVESEAAGVEGVSIDRFVLHKEKEVPLVEKAAKSFTEMITCLLDFDPTSSGVGSYTFAIKKTDNNQYAIRFYRGIMVADEKVLSEKQLINYLQKSGVVFTRG